MSVRTHPIFFSFTSGEISPKMEGRIDLPQYSNGVKELRNFKCLPQGGARSRGGFHFVSETKDNGVARLIPFMFSELQNYICEFGDLYIRFYMDNGQIITDPGPPPVPYEIDDVDGVPYELANDLWLIRYGQDDEYLYLVHPDYPPMVLTRTDHTTWTIDEIVFTWGAGGSPWSAENGYPRAICFHEGRILFASTYEQPQTIWGSKVNESGPTIDMTPGTEDSDGYAFTASELNIIRWVLPGRVLCIGALSGEATAIGPSDSPITPIDPPRIKSETPHGSSDLLAPIKIGKVILFLQKAGKKLRELAYSFADDHYNAPDLTIVSDHLFESGLIDLVYQQEPDSIIWGLTGDEELLGCTYDRTQNPPVVGWHKHLTDGYFESIASIPTNPFIFPYENRDQLWAIIRREIPIGEKVTNGSFTTDTGWTKGANWTISGGKASKSTGASNNLSQDITSVEGERYEVIYTIDSISGGTLTVSIGGVAGIARSVAGTYIEEILATGTDNLIFTPSAAGVVCQIDNVSVKVIKRYIEYDDPNICVDSGLTHHGNPISELGELEHLVSKDVEIVGDGAVYPPQTVPESGEITIDPPASEIYIGLGYTPRLITNRPEVSIGGGTSQGLKKRWNKITVRILDTMGIKINDEVIPARYGSDPMDEAPIPYSGDVDVTNLGWDTDGRITIEQPLPLPAHVVCITGSLVVGDD